MTTKLSVKNFPCDLKIEGLGFSEALRAAWMFKGREWAIIRDEDGSYLEFSNQRYWIVGGGPGAFVGKSSPLCPMVPGYWLDRNNWALCVGL